MVTPTDVSQLEPSVVLMPRRQAEGSFHVQGQPIEAPAEIKKQIGDAVEGSGLDILVVLADHDDALRLAFFEPVPVSSANAPQVSQGRSQVSAIGLRVYPDGILQRRIHVAGRAELLKDLARGVHALAGLDLETQGAPVLRGIRPPRRVRHAEDVDLQESAQGRCIARFELHLGPGPPNVKSFYHLEGHPAAIAPLHQDLGGISDRNALPFWRLFALPPSLGIRPRRTH
mmetsp:Transcript_16347/g.57122  ORF Transcript_16347/g.57122 Transcript_16347/m.57122 type:complete len:229 (-) Transcript_16347:334-1020(-)